MPRRRKSDAFRDCVAPKLGNRVKAMYAHYDKYGTTGMTKRQMRLLAREMDVSSVNPGKRKKSTWAQRSKWTRAADLRAWSKRMNRLRAALFMNPKRDGLPTRGEMRSTKRSAWLRTIVQRGRDAEAVLNRVKSVPAASAVAVAEHAPAKEAASVAVIEQAVEHAEANMIRSRIDDLSSLIGAVEDEMKDADSMDDDALLEELMEQKIKFAKQRTELKKKAESLNIRTNPRRGRRVLIGLKAYGRSLKACKRTLRAGR